MDLNDGSDPNLYMDICVTSYLASDIGKLQALGNGSPISITHIGQTTYPSSHRPLYLKNVLATPNDIKNLIYVH